MNGIAQKNDDGTHGFKWKILVVVAIEIGMCVQFVVYKIYLRTSGRRGFFCVRLC
jgi:hypothetical protein